MATTKKTAVISPKTPAAKAAPKATPAPVAAKDNAPVTMVRRKEMVERIVASSGLKPNAVKTVLDSVLIELGGALSAGEGLDLHPFGKITVNRSKVVGNKEILICKLRRKTAQSDDLSPENSTLQ